MKSKFFFSIILVLLGASASVTPVFSQGTAVTYQGVLADGGMSANGNYDFTFALFNAASGGGQIPGPITTNDVMVSNGLFTVTLDFGPSVAAKFPGADRWLQISVRTNGSASFTPLSPRQQVAATPYAVRAANFNGAVTDSQLPANVARLDGTNLVFSGAVQFTNPASAFSGTFSGSGSAVSNLTARAFAPFPPAGTIVRGPSFGGLNFGIFPFTSLISVDVNGDGRLDLVSGGGISAPVTVLINQGYGDFSVLYPPQSGIQDADHFAVVEDFNGDGSPDIVRTEDAPAGNMVVLTNNGVGVFAQGFSETLGRPSYGAAADFNGDGRKDVALVRDLGNELYVITNAGNAVFGPPTTVAVPGGPQMVATADVNRDKRAALHTANSGNGTLTVLTNDGTGVFALSANLVAGTGAQFACAADVNGDGRVDLVSANAGGNTLGVFTNNGSGGFALAATPGTGAAPRVVAVGDVNADGRADLISATVETLTLLTNDGSGGFSLAGAVYADSFLVGLAADDFTGDGRLDFAVANMSDGSVTLLLNRNNEEDFRLGNFAVLNQANVFTASNHFTGDVSIDKTARIGRASTFGGGATFNGFAKFNSDVTVSPFSMFFGSTTRQMVNLWGVDYGIGVQSGAFYFRTDGGFAPAGFTWFKGGSHNDAQWNPGGGTELMRLDGSGNLKTLTGTISSLSDRNAKTNFIAVDGTDVLEKLAALPITLWNFKSADASQRHIGPMAQDFYAAFGVGLDDKSICTVDADGVALAAIQGLNRKLEQKETEIAELKARLEALEKTIRHRKPD